MAEAGRARLDLDALASLFVGWEADLLRHAYALFPADTQLAHASFTPSVHDTVVTSAIVRDCEGVEGSRSDVGDVHDVVHSAALHWVGHSLVEESDELGSGSDLNGLGETKLAFISAAPCVKVAPVRHDHGVALATCNHGDALVSQWLQDLGLLRSSGATVTRHALVAAAHAEDIAIAGQVQRMVLAAGD